MDTLDHQRKFLLSVIVSATIATSCVVGFIISILLIKNYQMNFLHTRQALALFEQEISQVSGLEKLLSDIQNNRKELDGAFIESDQVVQFIEELERIALSYNSSINIQSFEVNEASTPPRFVFDVFGDLNSVMAFVERLEYLPYQIEIVSLFVNPDVRDARGFIVPNVIGFNIIAVINNFVR